MNLAPVLALIQERTGLDPGALGAGSVAVSIRAHMARLSLEDPVRFAARLASDPAEMVAMIDEVVVPETWFFRGGELFFYLGEQARVALRDRPSRPFRCLSIPCSTGEEPFSLAIACTELGLPTARWSIDGVDISSRHLALARLGRYGEMSFRQTSAPHRQRYFTTGERGAELRSEIRQKVRFLHGNLLDPHLLRGEQPYDLVFCRNLCIYLTPTARVQALASLERLTAPDGLLCLGHADSLPLDGQRWQRSGPPAYFLFRHAAQPSAVKPAPVQPGPDRSAPVRPIAPHQGDERDVALLLQQARRLADAGQNPAALARCREAEQRFGPSADLCTLTGILHQALQQPELAVQALRKALYLQPDHREALMHLMLLYQHLGQANQSEVMRRRLERLAVAPGGTP